jgi:hypothetical protein
MTLHIIMQFVEAGFMLLYAAEAGFMLLYAAIARPVAIANARINLRILELSISIKARDFNNRYAYRVHIP